MPLLNHTDAELWAAVRCNDEAAFQLLFERYWVRLYKTACRHIQDREFCEEMVHDIFVNIWERRAKIEIQSFPAFLNTVVRYQVHNYYRTKRPMYVVSDAVAAEDIGTVYNDGANRVEELDLYAELNYYLQQLPKRCQEIFQMSRMDHLSNHEIAERLGISKRTVENQITYALKHLRVSMKHIAVMMLILNHF